MALSPVLIAGCERGRALLDILLVDDDEAVLRTVGRFLSARGHRVRAALGGSEAMPLIEEASPDLVISDIQMPGMNGISLLEEIREQHPDMPVVLTTGHATVDTAVAALRRGAMDYLAKPIDLEELLTCIQRVEGSGDPEG